MKRPYLVPIVIFCVLVLASLTLLWDDHPAKKEHHAIRHVHVKLPPEEVKSRFQMAYEKACSDMLEKNYNDVKKYCLKVLKEDPRRKVSSEESSFIVGPAALNMLAEVYSAQKDYDAAMESYQQMIALYRDETFQSYQEGEDFWEGKAGAAGMLGQIRILTQFKHDLPKAHNVLVQLMNTYQGQSPKRWEWKESYDSAGARWITKYLQDSKAPINQWANELNAIIAKTSDRELTFDLTTTLARRYAANKLFDQSANLYHQLIAQHELEYWTSPEDGTFFYGMEAYKELIDFYQKTGQQDRMAAEKLKMRALYQKLLIYVKTKKIPYGAETLKGYEPYFR